jgi:RNA polymerase sigma-70 factor, ECF subfamily
LGRLEDSRRIPSWAGPTVTALNLDEHVHELCRDAQFDRATTLVLQQLGPAVFRYVAARARDEDMAAEGFARFAEDLWRGMQGFSGRSSVRVWAFVIARNAVGQVMRTRKRERKRTRGWSSTLANRVAEQVRTKTQEFLRTETKERFAELRSRLSPEEQALLVLRINERLSWEEIARIHADAQSEAQAKREAARLRKRFQLVRDKLRKMARAEGLLTDDADRER